MRVLLVDHDSEALDTIARAIRGVLELDCVTSKGDALLLLRQGVGRLIRTRKDQGMVVILDPRILSKPYGRAFLASLPDCPTDIV